MTRCLIAPSAIRRRSRDADVREGDPDHHPTQCSTAQYRIPDCPIAPPKSESAALVIGLSRK